MTDATTTVESVELPQVPEPIKDGAFREALVRTNRKIRTDRADAIVESAQLLFRRTVEDLRLNITRKIRERDNMLDLSPENAHSLVLAADFDAQAYVDKELELGVAIRNDAIKLDIATTRYKHLFGEEI